MSKYGSSADITGSLIVDGGVDLGSGDDDVYIDSDTVFVDASTNRVGIKTESPAYELHVAGNMGVNEYIYHNDDADTFIRFEDDEITAKAGNVSFINITEDDSQDKISFNEGRGDVDFIVRSPDNALALYLNAGNEVFHVNHNETGFKTKIHSTNGEAITVDNSGVVLNEDGTADNDLRVESGGEDEAIFLNAGTNTLYINKGATGFTTIIKSTNEEAIRVGAAGVILNQYGHADNDFRVESDNDTHMLFVDAGNDNIGIGTSSPSTSAILEISSSNKGLMLPRVLSSSKPTATSALNGLMIYEEDTHRLKIVADGEWHTIKYDE